MLCQVYRSPRREEMYLYTEKSSGLDKVPAPLLRQFGEPEAIMMLLLDGSKQLARADVDQVKSEIQEKGFYLQMPPGPVESRAGDGDNA